MACHRAWLLLAALAPTLTPAQEHTETAARTLASCYNVQGMPQRCLPEFGNAAFGVQMTVNNTCGDSGDTMFCFQTAPSRKSCDVCTPGRFQASFLTDIHHEYENQTWWQSETMNEGIQYPSQVDLILNLGKAFDITYIRLVFLSPRPESFAIFKRATENGEWEPYQYYSLGCREMYGLPDSSSASRGSETRALCTSEYSEMTPLTGGNVLFSTLEGRPSAHDFDNSPELQQWVTATDIRISLNRLNTFGDEVFGDQQVLQSYWYAIADIAVGARCKCNGHASRCEYTNVNNVRERRCFCEHKTDGKDCEKCLDFYNDAPWGKGYHDDVHECKPCNCNGYSKQCFFDKQLYDRTGHGGHCINCTQNRDGPNCERCKENYYQRRDNLCVACSCNHIGSRSLQCNSEGKCQCKAGVTGEKCDRCASNYYQFTSQGCKPCLCSESGSMGNLPDCNPDSGVCRCKENVEGRRCGECKPGYFNLDNENEYGCTPCFCYGHSSKCKSATGHSKMILESSFARNHEKWTAQDSHGKTIGIKYHKINKSIAVSSPSKEYIYFMAPKQYLGDQRASYNHFLMFTFYINESQSHTSQADLILESGDMRIEIPIHGQGNNVPSTQKNEYVFRLHENSNYEWSPNLRPREFMSLLSNLTSIRIRGTYSKNGIGVLENFKMETAQTGGIAGQPALWIEMCDCPKGFVGQFCESCASGYRHSPASGSPFKPCVPCDCNEHAQGCDSETGQCICKHNTAGVNCELCAKGYYGNALMGTPNDCKECPCPNRGACIQLKDIVCTECPTGYAGSRCESCSDGYFGDPNGRFGPKSPCKTCECNQNIDMNAVANCNQTTGECLKCIYNTAGSSCDRCLPGYFGDALAQNKGDCRQCECDRLGTWLDDNGIPQCNSLKGKCTCKPNVQGWNCDKCMDGFYNIASGEGCQTCNCNTQGSHNNTCDIETGQCQCLPGVTGLQCDQCKLEHYGFSSKGCKECLCDPIGSNGLQCDALGQCPCFENVEGLHCDMCKENKYDRQNGCKNCEPCYNLVQDAVNLHRKKLNKLLKMLSDIEESPTVIPDSDFDVNLATVKEKINNILLKTSEITGENGETLIQELKAFDTKLDKINNQLKMINEHAKTSQQLKETSSTIIKNAEEIIENSAKEFNNAMEYLQVDGAKAYAKAQNRSVQFGEQSTNMSIIAQESRLIAEKLEHKASNINGIASQGLHTAEEAKQLAKTGLELQFNISNELTNLHEKVSIAEKKAKDIQAKATNSLQTANSVYDKSFEIYANVNSLNIPKTDVKIINSEADELIFEAKKIKDRVDKLIDDNSEMLGNVEDQIDYSRNLLNRSEELFAEIQGTLANLEDWREKGVQAIELVNKKYIEAQNTVDNLKQFHNKVQESKTKAYASLEKIPKINDTINEISEDKENLDEVDQNAKLAKTIAEEAHIKYAKNASEESEIVRKAIIEVIDAAEILSNEAKQLPSRINISEDRIIEAEKKSDERQRLTSQTTIKVQQVKIDVIQAEKAVQKGIDDINSIMNQLKNLPDLDEKDLDTLARRIDDAEKEVKNKNLTKQIKELQTTRNAHQRWLKDYEDEVKKLEAEVKNVKEIAEALPKKCVPKNLILEP